MAFILHENKNKYGRFLLAVNVVSQKLKITKILRGDTIKAVNRLLPTEDKTTRDQKLDRRNRHKHSRLR